MAPPSRDDGDRSTAGTAVGVVGHPAAHVAGAPVVDAIRAAPQAPLGVRP